jgi:hypothetical protein
MACGKPVVTTAAGPALEFCPPDASYLIRATETPVADPPPFGEFSREWTWFEPDLVELVAPQRAIYENRDDAKRRGIPAGELIVRTHAWPRIMPLYAERIRRLMPSSPDGRIRRCFLQPIEAVVCMFARERRQEGFFAQNRRSE